MIIPEIKMSEALSEKNFEYYLEKIEPYPIVSVNTSSLFDGNLKILEKVASRYQKKKIIRKDFIEIPRQIEESAISGADYVLLLVEYLKKSQLERMIEECYKEKLSPLLEVNSYKRLPSTINSVLVNSRDLNTGFIDRRKAENVCKRYMKDGIREIIFGSNENSDEIVKRGIANYVLIGTAFMKEVLKR